MTRQLTAKTAEQVMWWIETTAHHIASAEDSTHMILKGHGDILRVPYALWEQCSIKAGDNFDRRMYRWDHEAARAKAMQTAAVAVTESRVVPAIALVTESGDVPRVSDGCNINDRVRVTLTDAGLARLKNYDTALHKTVGSDDVLETELWMVMNVFGGTFGLGRPQTIHRNRITFVREKPRD